MTALAIILLWLASAYLFGIGIVAIVRPALAVRFFGCFAQSRRANWIEAIVRGAIGLAMVVAARALPFSTALTTVGCFLVATAVAMPLFPGLHRRFARRSVAAVAPFIPLVGVGALIGAIGLGRLLWPR